MWAQHVVLAPMELQATQGLISSILVDTGNSDSG